MEKQTAVSWLIKELYEYEQQSGNSLTFAQMKPLLEQAKEMEKQKNISLVEWIRENTVEVQDGWQYLGELYTDKQIIEIYNNNN